MKRLFRFLTIKSGLHRVFPLWKLVYGESHDVQEARNYYGSKTGLMLFI